MSTTTSPASDSKTTRSIKYTFPCILALVIANTVYVYFRDGGLVALSYAFAWIGFGLIVIGGLFPSKTGQALTAGMCFGVSVVSFALSPPWDAQPHDPKIRHTFTAPGYKVSLASGDSCIWLNGENGQSYLCNVTVEALAPQPPAPASTEPADETEAATPPTAAPASAG